MSLPFWGLSKMATFKTVFEEPLGLTDEQQSALKPSYTRLARGAADTARQLVTAGASPAVAVPRLIALAKSLTVAAGGWDSADAAAAVPPAVPPAVQGMAEALMAGGMPDPPAARELHTTAAALAHPCRYGEELRAFGDEFPPCPWLLQHLVHLHTSGQLAAPASAYAPALHGLLYELSSSFRHEGAAASLLQWLATPTAAQVPAAQLSRLCSGLCHPSRLAALQAVLQREDVRQELRSRDGSEEGIKFTLLLAAVNSASVPVLDAELAATGGGITSRLVASLLNQSSYAPDGGLASLQLLLSRAVPPVPAEGPLDACPIYAVLTGWRQKWGLVSACICTGCTWSGASGLCRAAVPPLLVGVHMPNELAAQCPAIPRTPPLVVAATVAAARLLPAVPKQPEQRKSCPHRLGQHKKPQQDACALPHPVTPPPARPSPPP